MDIKITHKKVFKDLFRAVNGLHAYTLYSRFKMEPSEVLDFIDEYEHLNIIKTDDEQRIFLTQTGRDLITPILNNLKSNILEKSPFIDKMKSTSKIGLFKPYLPSVSFYDNYIKERNSKETSR